MDGKVNGNDEVSYKASAIHQKCILVRQDE